MNATTDSLRAKYVTKTSNTDINEERLKQIDSRIAKLVNCLKGLIPKHCNKNF